MIRARCKSACTWALLLSAALAATALSGTAARAQVPDPAAPTTASTTTAGPDAEARAREEAILAAEQRRLDALRQQYEEAGPDRGAAAEQGVPRSYVAQLLQTVLMLVAICALAYLLLGKLLPKFLGMTAVGRRAMIAAPAQGLLHVVDRLPLDPRRMLMVVRVGEEHFLVGVADQSMTLLARLDDSSFAEALEAGDRGAKLLGPFARLLERRMDKEGG